MRALSRGRRQQLGSGVAQKKFPDPAPLTVIAGVLELDITTIVLTLICAAVEDTANDGSSTDLGDGSGMRLEWLKSGAPSLQHGNGVTKDVKQ